MVIELHNIQCNLFYRICSNNYSFILNSTLQLHSLPSKEVVQQDNASHE